MILTTAVRSYVPEQRKSFGPLMEMYCISSETGTEILRIIKITACVKGLSYGL